MLEATAEDGSAWESFRSDAIAVYRMHGRPKEALPHYVLGHGFDILSFGSLPKQTVNEARDSYRRESS